MSAPESFVYVSQARGPRASSIDEEPSAGAANSIASRRDARVSLGGGVMYAGSRLEKAKAQEPSVERVATK